MAKAKTGSFWLTDEVTLTTVDSNVQSTISTASYVDIGDRQALAIEEVHWVVQAFNTTNSQYSNSFQGAATGDTTWGMQLSDLNPGTNLISATDDSLIASGAILYDDGNNVASIGPDIVPDTFGLEGARMVVNDTLYIVCVFNGNALAANREYKISIRVKAKIVTLSLKDFMSIAVQSSASS
jgi:hypothetical protein